MSFVRERSRTTFMQPSKSVSSSSTSAPFEIGCTSWAVEIFPRGSSTTLGIPAAAQYAESAAEVSPVEAQATARTRVPRARISFTAETRTVIPRSLNEPVCVTPHSFTQTSSSPISRA